MTPEELKKNLGMTRTRFSEMLYALKEGDESLFENIFLAHYKECVKYIKRRFKASHEDAYDVTMETLIDFRNRLIQNKVEYGNIRFLITQMASQKYTRWIRKNTRSWDEDRLRPEDDQMSEDDLELLDKAWKKLGEECRYILQRFYYEEITLKEMAPDLNKSPAALRKQKERCIGRLRQLFRQHR